MMNPADNPLIPSSVRDANDGIEYICLSVIDNPPIIPPISVFLPRNVNSDVHICVFFHLSEPYFCSFKNPIML